MSKNNSPLSYYGGKANLVDQILPLIPKHTQYVEPFIGGGAVFFSKIKSQHEVINDFDGRLINFYECLHSDELFIGLQQKIQATLHSELSHKKAKAILKSFNYNGDKVENAWAYWVQTQMSFSFKLFGGFAFSNDLRGPLNSDNKKIAFTKQLHNRLKYVEIFNRDAIDLILRKDSKETFFYFDPPYAESDCGQYDKLKEVYYRLLAILPDLKGKWLMSSYPSNQLKELRLSNNWFFRDIDQNLSVNGTQTKGKRKIECLTWNYDIHKEQRNLFNL